MRCNILAYHENSGLPENLHEDWCQEVVDGGSGPCERMVRASRWHRAYTKAEIVRADGSSSGRDGVGVAFSFLGE